MAFDPWSYDSDKDCYISVAEATVALHDYSYLGTITEAQWLQVFNLWQNGTKNPACGVTTGWVEIGSLEFTLTPPVLGGWVEIGSIEFTLTPPVTGGWEEIGEMEFELIPEGFIPTCSVDADCPEGYVCKDGKCVKKEAVFPWKWLAIAGAAIAGVILLIPRPKKAKER